MPHILANEYKDKCPIWGTPAHIFSYEGRIKQVISPRVGVPYLLDRFSSFNNDRTFEYITNDNNVHKAKLTTIIIDNNHQKESRIVVGDEYVLQVKEQTRMSFSQRMSRLLKYLITESEEKFVGYKIHMNSESLMHELAHYSLYKRLGDEEYAKSVKRCYGALAWSESTKWPELSFLVEQLSKRDLLDIADTYGHGLSCQVMGEGYIKKDEEDIRGALFGDFLGIADDLMLQKFKDPSAVLAGVALEVHLRKLCIKNNINPNNNNDKPRKANDLNAELARKDVYQKSDMKDIAAWLDRRNDAVHGYFGRYDHDQVKLLIQGVRGFVTRYPA